MNDPYSVLGISQSASDEEIKKAYRELVRKYHPDNYHDNPLSDLAQEKMKEINEAYDQIIKMREGGGSTGYRGGGSTYTGPRSEGGSTAFSQIRSAINAGNIALAEDLLQQSRNRNAEWHFLMGSVYYRKGWMDEATRYYQMAVNMEPNNIEYRQALSYMHGGGGFYRQTGGGMGSGIDACDCCTGLMLADCCCRCMGPGMRC